MAVAVSLRSLFSRVKDLPPLAPPVVSGGGAWVRRWSGYVPICWLSQWWRVVSVAARGGSAWFERWCVVVARVIRGVYLAPLASYSGVPVVYLAPTLGVFGGVALRLALSSHFMCGFDSFSVVLVAALSLRAAVGHSACLFSCRRIPGG